MIPNPMHFDGFALNRKAGNMTTVYCVGQAAMCNMCEKLAVYASPDSVCTLYSLPALAAFMLGCTMQPKRDLLVLYVEPRT